MTTATRSVQEFLKHPPLYTIHEGSFLLDAPPEKVWPHVVNYTSWQNFSIAQRVAGEAGQEGEVVYLKKEEAGSATAPYYARTIKVEPLRRIMWKTFRENVEYFGIVEFKIEPVQGQTRFHYSVIYEHVMPELEGAELEAFRKQNCVNIEAVFATVFPKLQALVEQGA